MKKAIKQTITHLMMTITIALGVIGGFIAGDGDYLFGGVIFAIGFVILLIKWRLETIWNLYPSKNVEKVKNEEDKELES